MSFLVKGKHFCPLRKPYWETGSLQGIFTTQLLVDKSAQIMAGRNSGSVHGIGL